MTYQPPPISRHTYLGSPLYKGLPKYVCLLIGGGWYVISIFYFLFLFSEMVVFVVFSHFKLLINLICILFLFLKHTKHYHLVIIHINFHYDSTLFTISLTFRYYLPHLSTY